MIDYIDKILQGDCLTILPTLPHKSIHCCVTSPPYWNLRKYSECPPTVWPEVTYSIFGMPITIPAMTCELGLEKDPKEYIGHMVLVFREVQRVLRDDATCWLNIGDSYAGYWGDKYAHKPFGEDRTADESTPPNKASLNFVRGKRGRKEDGVTRWSDSGNIAVSRDSFLKPKDMVGIPFMLAFALRDDGWYLRSDIIWAKKNCMPESVTDRPTKSHEYIFLLAKSDKYFYDAEAIKTPAAESSKQRGKTNGNMKAVGRPIKYLPEGQANIRKARDKQRGHSRKHAGFNDRWDQMDKEEQMSMGANKRTVWHLATNAFKEAHFATFPEELIVDPIKAGTSEHGCCSECGTPHVRIVDKELVPGPKAAKTFVVDGRDAEADKQDQGSNRQKDGHKPGWIYQSQTIGWTPQCKCNVGVAPCVILDPFSGAGTTFMVAKKLNRRAVGIEISPVYVPMSEKRVNDELGMFSPLK